MRIPLLIELRGNSPRNLSPEQILAIWAAPYGIDVRALLKLLIAGRLLLIFEGFDEVDLFGNTESRLRHFGALWKLCYPQAKILITGRPNFFLDDVELKTALGIQQPSVDKPYCEALHLAPFNITQIRNSLRNVTPQSCDEICALAQRDDKFHEIISRPSLLYIVSTLWRRENLSARNAEMSSALVMDLFIQHSYRRQGAIGAEQDPMALNNAERAYFMNGIAVFMTVNHLPNQISAVQLNQAVRKLILAVPECVSRAPGMIAGETRTPLRQRFDLQQNASHAIECIQTDVRACGLLVNDLGKTGSFKFAHKSFMEFLAAQVFADWQLGQDKALNIDATAALSIVNSLELEKRHMLSSRESLSFAAELLAQPFRGDDTPNLARRLLSVLLGGGWRQRFNIGMLKPALWLTERGYQRFGLKNANKVFGLVWVIVATGACAGAVEFAGTFAFAVVVAFVVAFSFASVGAGEVVGAAVSTVAVIVAGAGAGAVVVGILLPQEVNHSFFAIKFSLGYLWGILVGLFLLLPGILLQDAMRIAPISQSMINLRLWHQTTFALSLPRAQVAQALSEKALVFLEIDHEQASNDE